MVPLFSETSIWGFPEIGVPPVIIHFRFGFSLINPPLGGIPIYGNHPPDPVFLLGPTQASPIRSVATDLAGVAMERCQVEDLLDATLMEEEPIPPDIKHPQ